jgi:eukaryotic-like serine/threonine-protein kinase
MNPIIGRTVNNYEIRTAIGEGGMGVVYLAEHPRIGRRAAIKILRDGHLGDQRMVDLFVNEARAANTIHHPNIIDIIDVGRLPCGNPYLMMELLEGETLGDRLRRVGVLPLEDALDVAGQAARGLEAAHQHGIVHQDLKPDNLFLSPDPDRPHRERVKILDFGIAKLRGEPHPGRASREASAGSSGHSLIFGSPFYMSPEQCRGEDEDIDHRTDIYAMGALLYHLLCGAPPFVDDTLIEVLVMHMRQPPRPPRALNPQIPPHVEAAILRSLAKHPEERFDSMAQLVEALEGPRRIGAAPLEQIADEPTGPILLDLASVRAWKPAFILLGAALVLAAAMLWPPRRPVPRAPAAMGERAMAPERVAMPPAVELVGPRWIPEDRPTPVATSPRRAVASNPIMDDEDTWGRRH